MFSNSGKMIPWPGNWLSAPLLFMVNMQKASNDRGAWKGNLTEIYPFVAMLLINVLLNAVERHLSGREIGSLLAISTKPTITLKIVTIPSRSNKDCLGCVWFQSFTFTIEDYMA